MELHRLLGGKRGLRPWQLLTASLLGVLAFGLAPIGVAALTGVADGMPFVGPVAVRAATPSPSPPSAGDTRSAGEGPGLVGEPVVAVLGVLGLALGAVAVTLLYVRLTGGPRAPNGGAGPSGAGG